VSPHEFLAKWRQSELKERSASQSHFNDLCALLGVADPVTADPTGEWFTFEKGASKTGGGEGWADVWRKGCFAWEYKGRHANLEKANSQLLQYAVALENPPLLIVSDMDRIVIRTNWTNTVQETHAFALDDLVDGAVRDRLKAAFLDPETLKPKKSRQELTEETAGEFAGLAQRLRERGHDAHQVAHFVNRLVFCMFAEDVGLLPDKLFTKMLEVSRLDPAAFTENARTLFGAMAHPGGKVGFTAIEWFNGGLFEDDHVLPLSADDIDQLRHAAGRDWSQIDPSILGTLFERGLDPAKRTQLGAHYTDRDKIMLIVGPTIIEPLEADWAEALARMTALVEKAPVRTAERLLTPAERGRAAKLQSEAAALHSAFIERLAQFRVLDPACGSGNFLYVALRSLKDIEHRANLDAEALGLPRGFPRVGPECVLGIELNPYAAELARISVWIGEIQWMRRNGFDAARNPILRPLETIECRDAVLNEDGARAQWPEADVVIGNPPFLGGSKMLAELGDSYTSALRAAWPAVPGGADLVCFWFSACWDQLVKNSLRRVGLVSTNSIRGGANREVLKPIVKHGRIYEAWSDEGWTVEGAAVRVSIVCFSKRHDQSLIRLNGVTTSRILADLTPDTGTYDLSSAAVLRPNLGICNRGVETGGPFEMGHTSFRDLLGQPANPNGLSNGSVLKQILNGNNILKRADPRYMIDFGPSTSLNDASLFEGPFEHLRAAYDHYRDAVKLKKRQIHIRADWWLHRRTAENLRRAIRCLDRFIVTPRVGRHRIFIWMSCKALPDSAAFAIARDDDTAFGILHSRFHELWSLRMGTFVGVGNDPRYTPSTTFETFPFPEGLTPDIPAADYADNTRSQKIAAAAARLSELRENWLNPADLVVREPEVVPGYPDRILPRDEEAAKELRKRTLTNLYNARPQWLANAHAVLDAAVAEAYGWGDDWRAGLLTDDEILARLFRLNQERSNANPVTYKAR
jgi:type II restriction/modification system DNA methylase subunit YeeA